MAVWTDVTGYVLIKPDSHFSIKKYIKYNFQEAEPEIRQSDYSVKNRIDLKFSFSDGNLSAAKAIQQFVDAIKDADNTAWIVIDAHIRFVS